MSDPFVNVILAQYAEIRDYSQRLVADLRDGQMTAQPVPGVTMNHPAWILSHLSVYGPIVAGSLRGTPVEDPRTHRYGRESTPLSDPHEYLPRRELMTHFVEVYDDAAAALRDVDLSRLELPVPIERWRSRFPSIAHLPIQFLIKHPATHLGQMSAWRRAMGLPPV